MCPRFASPARGVLFLVGVVLVTALGGPATAQARTSGVIDEGAAYEGDKQGGFCDEVPVTYEWSCKLMSGLTDGPARSLVQGGATAALRAVVEWVVEAAGWRLGQMAGLIDTATSPDVETDWFRGAYVQMTVIAVTLMLPLLLLSTIQALLRVNGAQLGRLFFVYVPVASLGMFAATAVTQMLLQVTDALSAWVGASVGADLSQFATNLAAALTATTFQTSGFAVPGFAALLAALLVGFSTMVIWVLLVLRQAAIYAGVLFLPLAFAGLVWPATGAWFKRLVEGLVAIIFSKFVIVAVLSMAASSLASLGVTEGFSVVVAGGSLLLMAVFAPFVLLKLIPVFGSELASTLDGVTTSRTSPVPAPSGGQMYRQIAAANRGRMAAAGAGAGGVVIAGADAVRAGADKVKGAAEDVAGHAKDSGGGGGKAPPPPAGGGAPSGGGTDSSGGASPPRGDTNQSADGSTAGGGKTTSPPRHPTSSTGRSSAGSERAAPPPKQAPPKPPPSSEGTTS